MTRTMAAAEFKAKCLAVLDEVAQSGESVLVTKRGKVVARLVPASGDRPYPQDALEGTVSVLADIVSPAVGRSAWSALAPRRGRTRR